MYFPDFACASDFVPTNHQLCAVQGLLMLLRNIVATGSLFVSVKNIENMIINEDENELLICSNNDIQLKEVSNSNYVVDRKTLTCKNSPKVSNTKTSAS